MIKNTRCRNLLLYSIQKITNSKRKKIQEKEISYKHIIMIIYPREKIYSIAVVVTKMKLKKLKPLKIILTIMMIMK